MIAGLTTCVGDEYALYLGRALPTWKKTLDELLVVTDEKTFNDHRVIFALCQTHVTDIFTAHGASFNKGAALSEGFAVLSPTDWILNFDSDILPPPRWRKIAEPHLQPGKLFGSSHRYRENGSLIPDADFPNIWGYFHLWHISDSHSWQRPVFDSTCGHAGNYDHSFMMQWEPNSRVDLWPDLRLTHQGEPRRRWFGRDEKNEKKMMNLFTLGLWDAWLTRAGHIKPPYPPEEISLDGKRDPALVVHDLRKYTVPDPFKYRVTVKR